MSPQTYILCLSHFSSLSRSCLSLPPVSPRSHISHRLIHTPTPFHWPSPRHDYHIPTSSHPPILPHLPVSQFVHIIVFTAPTYIYSPIPRSKSHYPPSLQPPTYLLHLISPIKFHNPSPTPSTHTYIHTYPPKPLSSPSPSHPLKQLTSHLSYLPYLPLPPSCKHMHMHQYPRTGLIPTLPSDKLPVVCSSYLPLNPHTAAHPTPPWNPVPPPQHHTTPKNRKKKKHTNSTPDPTNTSLLPRSSRW